MPLARLAAHLTTERPVGGDLTPVPAISVAAWHAGRAKRWVSRQVDRPAAHPATAPVWMLDR